MLKDDSFITGYMFYSLKLDSLIDDNSYIQDYSSYSSFTTNVFAVSEEFCNLTYDQFYVPNEVNG